MTPEEKRIEDIRLHVMNCQQCVGSDRAFLLSQLTAALEREKELVEGLNDMKTMSDDRDMRAKAKRLVDQAEGNQ